MSSIKVKYYYSLLCCIGVGVFVISYIYLDDTRIKKLQSYRSNSISSFSSQDHHQPLLLNISDGYQKLLNIYFRYKHLPEVCNESDRYVIAVHTAPNHLENRIVIRTTWGQKDFGIKVLFLVANTTDKLVQRKIDIEASIFKDLIQGDFVDSYRNLSYKHVLALKFVVENCSNIKYLIKVDDDSFINTPNLKKFLDLYDLKYGNNTNLLCKTMTRSPILRYGRWKVSEEMLAGEFYPMYCSGYFIIYPIAAASAIYQESQKEGVKFLWVDDAFVSGVLARKAGIHHTSIKKLSVDYAVVQKFEKDFIKSGGWPFLVGRMNLSIDELKKLWAFVKDHVPKADILKWFEG